MAVSGIRARLAAVGLILTFTGAAAFGGCSDEELSPLPIESIYALPASFDELAEETFFDHPFPSDLRLEQGHVRFAGWPNPRQVPLLAEYIGFIDKRLDGFSPVAAGFLRFDGSIDPSTLPTAEESRTDAASVQLVDIDPESPQRGERHPIYLNWRRDPGIYWVENTLSFGPVPGHPLRFHNRYALVVTDKVKSESGGPIVAAKNLKQVLGIDAPGSEAAKKANALLAPAVAELAEQGLAAEHIVHLAVFTTDDPTEEYMAAARDLPNQIEAPAADPSAWALAGEGSKFDEYHGSFGPSPNFQVGEAPFTTFGDGGGFDDVGGIPQLQDTFDLRFSLSVPKESKCPMPADGYPIVMFAHGTGGDFRSYVYDGSAASLASQCIASMGVDQIFHGTRPGAPAEDDPDRETKIEIRFFNFNNIEAARTNIRQSGLDEMQRARLFTETHMTVPASISTTGDAIAFDASKLMFFGHSQGSLNGPLFMAANDKVRGGVLSGASSVMQITLLEKTQPEPSVATLVKTIFLQLLLDEQSEVDLLYPPLALAQTIVDPVDPGNYARYIISEPPEGLTPKSIYLTEGVLPDGTGDSYAPPRGCEALAITLGLPMQAPTVHEPKDALEGELPPITIPAEGKAGNLANGQASGVLAQWRPGKDDGHFVVFDIPEATVQAARFLRNLAEDPKGRVPAP